MARIEHTQKLSFFLNSSSTVHYPKESPNCISNISHNKQNASSNNPPIGL